MTSAGAGCRTTRRGSDKKVREYAIGLEHEFSWPVLTLARMADVERSQSVYRTSTHFATFPKQRNPDRVGKVVPSIVLVVASAQAAALNRPAGPPSSRPLSL